MEITAKHLYPYIFLFNGIYPFNSMIRKEYKHKKTRVSISANYAATCLSLQCDSVELSQLISLTRPNTGKILCETTCQEQQTNKLSYQLKNIYFDCSAFFKKDKSAKEAVENIMKKINSLDNEKDILAFYLAGSISESLPRIAMIAGWDESDIDKRFTIQATHQIFENTIIESLTTFIIH